MHGVSTLGLGGDLAPAQRKERKTISCQHHASNLINAKATKAGRSRTRCDRLAQMSERKRPMRQAAPVPRTPPRRSAPAASTDDIPNLELQCGHVTPRAAATPIGPPMPLPRPMPLSITSISASDLTAHLSDVSPRQTMQTMAHKQSPNPLLVRGAGTVAAGSPSLPAWPTGSAATRARIPDFDPNRPLTPAVGVESASRASPATTPSMPCGQLRPEVVSLSSASSPTARANAAPLVRPPDVTASPARAQKCTVHTHTPSRPLEEKVGLW